MTRIRLCGPLAVELEGRKVLPPGRQGRLLLAYLIVNRGRACSRDELVELLWPDAPPADPGEALSALLSRLRRALGERRPAGPPRAAARARATTRGWTSRRPPGWNRRRSRSPSGGFMVGDEAPWIEERRREVAELRLRALEAIAAHPREPAAAERAARELVEAAPFRESGHRLLMSALAAGGNVAEALRAYEDLRVRLRDELGAAPGPERPGAAHRAADRPGPRPEAPATSASSSPSSAPSRPARSRTRRTCARRMRGCARCSRASAPSTIRRWPCSACPPRTRTTRSAPCARRCRPASSAWRRAPGSRPARRSSSGGAATGAVRPPPSGCSGRPRAGATLADEATVHATRGALDFEPRRRLVGPRDAAAGGPRRGRWSAARTSWRRSSPCTRAVVAERRPHLVTVVGDAGIGKSRLVDEFGADHRGRCLPYGEGITYWALREILRARGRDRARRQRGRRGGQAAGAGRDAGRRRGRARHVRAGRQRRHRRCPARRARSRRRRRSRRRSGWPGRGSLSALGARGRRDRGPALGRAAAARSGRGDRRPLRRPAAAGRDRAPGAGRGAAGLGLPAGDVADRAPAAERRRDAASWSTVCSRRATRRCGSGWRARRRATRSSPRSSPGTSSPTSRGRSRPPCARCSPPASTRCPAIERRVLRHAAVVGRTFWPPALEPICELGPALRALEARGFVVPRATSALPGHTELAFVHGLTREVAYHSIPRADRCRTHAAVARWIEAPRRRPARGVHRAARLPLRGRGAPRRRRAGVAGRPAEREAVRAAALRALVDAGDAARRRMAIDQAARFADRALALALTDAERLPGARAEGPELPRRGARRRRAGRVHRGDRGRRAGSAIAPRPRGCAASRSCCARATAARSAKHAWVDKAAALVEEGLAVDGDEPASFAAGALRVGRSWGTRQWATPGSRAVATARWTRPSAMPSARSRSPRRSAPRCCWPTRSKA